MRNHGIRDLIYPRTPLKAQSEFGAPPLNPSQNNEKYGRFAIWSSLTKMVLYILSNNEKYRRAGIGYIRIRCTPLNPSQIMRNRWTLSKYNHDRCTSSPLLSLIDSVLSASLEWSIIAYKLYITSMSFNIPSIIAYITSPSLASSQVHTSELFLGWF